MNYFWRCCLFELSAARSLRSFSYLILSYQVRRVSINFQSSSTSYHFESFSCRYKGLLRKCSNPRNRVRNFMEYPIYDCGRLPWNLFCDSQWFLEWIRAVLPLQGKNSVRKWSNPCGENETRQAQKRCCWKLLVSALSLKTLSVFIVIIEYWEEKKEQKSKNIPYRVYME